MKKHNVFLAIVALILASLACEAGIPNDPQPIPTPVVVDAPVAEVDENTAETPGESPKIGSTMTGTDGATLVYVPAGKFVMGSDADDTMAECKGLGNVCKREWFTNQEPPHTVTLDAFWIDQTEVTNANYAKCVAEGVCKEPLKKNSHLHSTYYSNAEYLNYPVMFVNWKMAKTYCSWADRRLPTEAEWEKAARGPKGNIYPWGNLFDGAKANSCDKNCPFQAVKNFFDDGYAEVSPVGHYLSGQSIYRAYDMAGNVTEWVNDWYDPNYYQDSPASNPAGPTTGSFRSVRGDSWLDDDYNVRVPNRYWLLPESIDNNLGFRCTSSE